MKAAPLVVAHRGASGTEVENSLAAFRAAVQLGADAVELDVHASADGEILVHHDETVGGLSIPGTAAAALAGWRLSNGEPIPTLGQALAALPPTLPVFVEVKTLAAGWDERLFQTLDRGPNPRGYAVHSFDHAIVRRLVERRPTLTAGALLEDPTADPLAALAAARASMLWPERELVNEALVRAVHQAGRRVIVWTVDDPGEMARLADWGVDGICTNYPDRARRVIDSRAA